MLNLLIKYIFSINIYILVSHSIMISIYWSLRIFPSHIYLIAVKNYLLIIKQLIYVYTINYVYVRKSWIYINYVVLKKYANSRSHKVFSL